MAAHGLGAREREWLEFASLLHDIGNHISYERHNRHSYYLIKNGDLRGFEPEEIEVIALLTRYHRRGTPKKSHAGYSDLSGALAQDRPHPVRLPAHGRNARPQPERRRAQDRGPGSGGQAHHERLRRRRQRARGVGGEPAPVLYRRNAAAPVKIVAHHMEDPDEGAKPRSRKRKRTPAAAAKPTVTAALQAVH